MNTEFDTDLTTDQWEALKTLRLPASGRRILNACVIDSLVVLHLAAMNDRIPVITPRGRKVLVRGSSRLWDVAA